MTTKPPQDRIDAFFNALQLSVDCRISQVSDVDLEDYDDPKNTFVIGVERDKSDERFEYFTRMVDGKWLKNNWAYSVYDIETALSQAFINFLMLTRLRKESMLKLAQIDAQYKPFTKGLGVENPATETTITTIEDLRQHLFSLVEQRKMTLRELAARAGMTQVALSNFKRGANIRVTNFLNLCRALDCRVILKSATP